MAQPGPEERNGGAMLHETGKSVSSIGPKWPPVRASFDRIKGIFTPGPLNTLGQFGHDFFSVFNEYAQSPLFGQKSKEGFSRISMRAVVDNGLLTSLPRYCCNHVEAIIPLAETQPAFENHSIVYFGVNHPSRISDDHIREQNWLNVYGALEKQPKSPNDIIKKSLDRGYELDIIEDASHCSETVVDEVYRLIERFNYDISATLEILDDPNFTLGVARKDGKIVAVGLAETNEVEIGGNKLTMVELTEASTNKEHLGRGLYSGISTTVLQYLNKKSKALGFNGKEVDVVYGESNGSALGVLLTAAYQGRIFSTDVCRQMGFEGRGMLPLHVPILDPDEDKASEEIKRNNNLFPSFINKQRLYELYS